MMHTLSFYGIIIDAMNWLLIDVAAIMSFTEPFEIISDHVIFIRTVFTLVL